MVPKRPTIDSVRELTQADLDGLVRTKNCNPVKRHRDSHHMVARLFAMGLRPGEVAYETGYSLGRIATLYADPAFEQLISFYRSAEMEVFLDHRDEYYETVSANRRMSARLINDKLNDTEPEDISFRELVLIHADSADRTGYPKRAVSINLNTDFASLLDKAIQRSTSIEQSQQAQKILPGTDGGGQASLSESDPQPIRRRA